MRYFILLSLVLIGCNSGEPPCCEREKKTETTLAIIYVKRQGDQYIRLDNGKPIVSMKIGDKLIPSKWLDERRLKGPPLTEDEIISLWLDETPGIYKIEVVN